MTERRIIKRTYRGMERYVVQYKVSLLWIWDLWFDNPIFHVGNNNIDSRDDWGYHYLEAAQKALEICEGQDYVGEEVVK